MARKSVTRSAYTWKAFFEALRGKRDTSTETYVSTFSQEFNLAKSYYQIGGKVVLL